MTFSFSEKDNTCEIVLKLSWQDINRKYLLGILGRFSKCLEGTFFSSGVAEERGALSELRGLGSLYLCLIKGSRNYKFIFKFFRLFFQVILGLACPFSVVRFHSIKSLGRSYVPRSSTNVTKYNITT